MKKKILISPGFGSGWSTWCYDSDEVSKFGLTYQPLIDAIENGSDSEFDEAIAQFKLDLEEKFGDEGDDFYIGGNINDLIVVEVDQPFRINEYDGSESVEYWHDNAYIKPEEL